MPYSVFRRNGFNAALLVTDQSLLELCTQRRSKGDSRVKEKQINRGKVPILRNRPNMIHEEPSRAVQWIAINGRQTVILCWVNIIQ